MLRYLKVLKVNPLGYEFFILKMKAKDEDAVLRTENGRMRKLWIEQVAPYFDAGEIVVEGRTEKTGDEITPECRR